MEDFDIIPGVKKQSDIFKIVGENFFKPFVGQYKGISMDCLRIIYDSYRTELSYGIEREVVVAKLTDYFDRIDSGDIRFDEESEVVHEPRAKSALFLRRLRDCGWLEYEIGNDQKQRILMPNHAVTLLQTLIGISADEEMEYQGEVSAIYSLLTNEELLSRPYPQILKPVYERTLSLFTGLKKLNTSIRKHIEAITADKTSEQIIDEFFKYHDEIGSKAYHRIKTSDNIARFRNTIIRRLQAMRMDGDVVERLVAGCQTVENIPADEAADFVQDKIADVISHFKSYDELVAQIDHKHSKYIRNAVERAKFLLLSTGNLEGKISTVLQYMAEKFNAVQDGSLMEKADDDLLRIFNIFPQGFIDGESFRIIPLTRKMTTAQELSPSISLSPEEREARRLLVQEKNRNRFSRRNVAEFVDRLLSERGAAWASQIPVAGRRDMLRIIFIKLYGYSPRSNYAVISHDKPVNVNGFRFNDFEIKRKA